MEKLKMESVNQTKENIEKVEKLFPNVITETKDENGKIKKSINFNLLQQYLSEDLMEGDESYEFTWVGKKQSIIEGNIPIRKTLRPCVEESKDWDKTENLYFEGDNLEVLKLLQNSYLNSIKMIYIDPPYNTGKDFVYRDSFKISKDEYDEEIGLYDDEENRLFQNNESNGRFHSDWCSMMYPRIQLARNLLKDDGVIFISIDDNEVENLKKICNEIFGETNFIANIIWEKKFAPSNDAKWFSDNHDHILVFSRNKNSWRPNLLERDERALNRYKNPDEDKRGRWVSGDLTVKTYNASYDYEILTPSGRKVNPPEGICWRVSKSRFEELVSDNRVWFGNDGNNVPRLKRFLSEVKDGVTPLTIWKHKEVGHNQEAFQEVRKLFDGKQYFSTPKPLRLLKQIIKIGSSNNDIILDFFSGSGTTAHAVMELNQIEETNRKFICVQLPELVDVQSDVYKDGFINVSQIGLERIKLGADKIKNDSGILSGKIDLGYRVFKLDKSNMKDVYYGAGEYSQQKLLDLESNIKEDRTDLDLLYGVMLDWGVPLSLSHKHEKIGGKTVHFINISDLVACFEENINETVIREIAKRKPLRVVFRDSSFSNSPDKINVTEIFKTISPETTIKVI